MGFLYTTDSSISWLEWVVGNPTVGSIKRRPAVRKLLTALIQEAKTRGAKAVFTSVKHPKLMELYEEQGFLKTDREMTNMILGGL